jgi:hypothetical protein
MPDPYLIEMKKPTCTEEEVENYVYPKPVNGKPQPLKEEPIDEDNHGLDETRYVIAYVDGLNTIEVSSGGGYAGEA